MSSNSITKSYDSLPLLLRIIIQLIGGAIVGGVYRIVKFVENHNNSTLIAGIIALIPACNVVAWVIDLITLIVYGKYTVYAD